MILLTTIIINNKHNTTDHQFYICGYLLLLLSIVAKQPTFSQPIKHQSCDHNIKLLIYQSITYHHYNCQV